MSLESDLVKSQIMVFYDADGSGIDLFKVPDSEFSIGETVDGTTYVHLNFVPANGSKVEVKVFGGTLVFADTSDIAPGSITNEHLAGDIDWSKIDTTTMGGTNTYYLGQRSDVVDFYNIAASEINGFNTAVRTNRLDQMAVPTASLNLNSQKITSLADPENAQDAVTLAYLESELDDIGGTLQDPGRVVQGRVTVTNSVQTYTTGWAFDGLWLFIQTAGVSENSQTYYGQNYNWTVENSSADDVKVPVRWSLLNVQDGLDGNGEIRYKIDDDLHGGSAPNILIIQRTATGFTYKQAYTTVLGAEGSAVGNLTLKFKVIKNSSI